MALVKLHGGWIAAEHASDLIAIPVWDLGRPIKLQHVARRIVAGDGTSGLNRHGRMPSDCKIDADNRVRGCKSGLDVAVALAQAGRLGRETRQKLARLGLRGEDNRQILDLDRD